MDRSGPRSDPTPEYMQISIRGELEGFTAGWQQRLGSLVHGHLSQAALPVNAVDISVSRGDEGELTCVLRAGFTIHCELVVRETGTFLVTPVESACMRVRSALAEIARKSLDDASTTFLGAPPEGADFRREKA